MALSKQERAKAISKVQELNQGESSKDYVSSDYDEMKRKSLVQLAMRSKEGIRGATEYIKNYLLEKESIYTLRDSTEQVWIYREGIYVEHAETYIKDFCSRVFEQAYTDRLAKEVIDKIKARTFVNPTDFFDSEPTMRICTKNGILDLRSREFVDHTPDEFHFSKIPVVHDEYASCEKIIIFLEEVLKNPEQDLLVIQEMLGWLLMKEYKPEKAVMLYGGGRNGKGKTMEILERFIGDNNYSAVSLTELDPRNNQYASSQLMKKLANFGGDVGEGVFKDTSVLRGLTGRDRIEAQRKYLDPVRFRNYAKLIFAANQPPRIHDDHDGFWNRWVWLEFPYTFLPKEEYKNRNGENDDSLKLRDPDIVSKVLDDTELSGMLNWALEGLDRLLSNNSFSDSKTQDEIKVAWTRRSNSFEAFAMDHLVEDWDCYVEKSELRRAYSLYCRKHKRKGVSDDSIKVTLQERYGCGSSRPVNSDGSRIRCWQGIRFVEETENTKDDSKFSYSTLGQELGKSEAYRVMNCLNRLTPESMEGLVSIEKIEEHLPTVDVEQCLKYLNRKGDVFEPRKGFWKVLR